MPIDADSLKARQTRIEPPSNEVLNQPTPRDFRKGGGGSEIGFGIVRMVDDDNGKEILVTPAVERNDDEEGSRMKALDEKTTNMRVWPGTLGRDYKPFIWEGPPTDETTYLPVFKAGSRFYVMQQPKWDVADPPPDAEYTDCWPVQREV